MPAADPAPPRDLPRDLPPWARELARVALAALLAFLAARYGIVVPPPAVQVVAPDRAAGEALVIKTVSP